MRSSRSFENLVVLSLLTPLLACAPPATENRADSVADHARSTYQQAMISTTSELLAFKTVHQDGIDNADNSEFKAMTSYLRDKASELGLGFDDYGAVVVVSLGDGDKRLGLVTHGDVQPADPSKWSADPFELDTTSEPGRLVGRGVEDDKGPIAAALYAMKAVQDKGLVLSRRIELIVSYTEESDWEPFLAFLKQHPPPELNVVLDAEYPVVTAEKGWCSVHLTLAPVADEPAGDAPWLASFGGGAFLSQIPEDARAVVRHATAEVEAALGKATEGIEGVDFEFEERNRDLVVTARGASAHSSKPWEGKNGITHLAQVLAAVEWPDSQAARMVRLVNDLVGTGDYGTRFGDVAYEHPFMGRLTLALTTLETTEDGGPLSAGINIRRPAGRSAEEMEDAIRSAVASWQETSGVEVEVLTAIYDPHLIEDAVHVPVLLDVFRRHTGQQAAGPISIGGGTHARLVPNGVNFGPGMPGEPYTGHSEHEYTTRDQMVLNLGMYTAMLVELATAP